MKSPYKGQRSKVMSHLRHPQTVAVGVYDNVGWKNTADVIVGAAKHRTDRFNVNNPQLIIQSL